MLRRARVVRRSQAGKGRVGPGKPPSATKAAPGAALAEAGAGTSDLRKLSRLEIKNISLYQNWNLPYMKPIPARSEGRAHVTNVGRGCGGREVRKARRMTRTAKA